MFVAQQPRQPGVSPSRALLDPGSVEIQPQGESVDEHPHGSIGAASCLHAPEQNGSEHHPLAPGGPGDHLTPCQMAQAGRVTPSRRAWARSRSLRLCGSIRCASPISLPSRCTSARPNGVVGSPSRRASRGKKRSVLILRHTSSTRPGPPGCGTDVPAPRSLNARPGTARSRPAESPPWNDPR